METVGLVPLVPILLTINDGQGVPSDIDGAVRVIILSGAGDGQAVPQGAETVDFRASQYLNGLGLRDKNDAYLGAGANCNKCESGEDELHDAFNRFEVAKDGLATMMIKRTLVKKRE